MKDANCLARLAFMGLALARDDGRFAVSREGQARHAAEILRPPDPLAAAEKA